MSKEHLNLNQSIEFIKAWEAQIKEAEKKELTWNIPVAPSTYNESDLIDIKEEEEADE